MFQTAWTRIAPVPARAAMSRSRTWSAMGRTVLLALALVAQGSAAAAQDTVSALTARLTETAITRMEADGLAGVVMVLLHEGVPVWTRAFGDADPAVQRSLSEEAVFRVESLSKPVTAWAAMRLAESGRLDLDAPATACLRRWRPRGDVPAFTTRQLLSHTAGVGLGDFTERYAPDAARPDLPEHLERDFRMIAAPGARFSYSDTGYTLLELIIEDCTGEDFATFVAREIFAPLGMETATYDWPGPDMPVGHDLRGRPVAPYLYPGRGSGGLFATANDMARLAAAGMADPDRTVLSDAGRASLQRPVVPVDGLFGFAADGYALGHFTETLSDGRQAVWHGGQGYGWMSHMHLVPSTGDGIVIVSNSQRAWPLFGAILGDWSDSLGVAPVGMVRVLWAETAARIAIAAALTVAVLALWLAFRGARRPLVVRIMAGGIAVCLITWPLWALTRDYLFLFSILPRLWPWLGAASALAGAGLAALAVRPEAEK
jgi:CubicO group peptidase (beta-lactamase class C family)